MQNNFTLASWITNKIWENRYFLTLDIDWFARDDFDEKIKPELKNLIKKYNLSEWTIFATHSGFHVYFFYDNNFSSSKISEILNNFPLLDNNFRKTFEEFSKKWQWVTLRLNWKYKNQDIIFYDKIQGREPSLIEKTVWESTKMFVESQLRKSLLSNNSVTFSVNSKEPWIEKKVLKENNLPKIKPEKSEEKNTEKPQSKAKKERKYIDVNEVFPENSEITKQRELWYNWEKSQIIARLISSALESREWAYIKLRNVVKSLEEKNEGSDIKYDINNFIERRPFFLENCLAKDYMLMKYKYNVLTSGISEVPLHFFKSVASFDFTDGFLGDARKNLNLRNFAEVKNVRSYLEEHKMELLQSFDIVYDFDTPDANSDESYLECRKMRDEFKKMWLPFSLNFSWSKWFHIKIPGEILLAEVPELIDFIKKDPKNIREVFRWLEKFAENKGIIIDKWVYAWDLRCLIRVEWSVHPATWSVTKPLSDKEFDSLSWKTLAEIQEMYKPSNLLSGSKKLGVKRLNFQNTDIEVRYEISGEFLTWEDMKNSGNFSEEEWKSVRDFRNETNKELKKIAKSDPKHFNEILASGLYDHNIIEAPEYIDLTTWRNYNYLRFWKPGALRKFVQDLGIDGFDL